MANADILQADELTREIARDCLLTRARRIGRAVTAIYDNELRPYGLNSPQMSLLVLISRLDGATRAELGRANNQERSTLSRNLALLLEEGWVTEMAESGRNKPISLSDSGRELMLRAGPGWRNAQDAARKLIGDEGVLAIIKIGDSLEDHELG